MHKFSPKKESRDQPQKSIHQRMKWRESLTEGPKILGPPVRNLFIRNYWLPRFVHPWRNANPGITLTNSVGRSPWQGWQEKWFRPYFTTVCSVSLSIHFHFSYFPPLFLLFSVPVVLSLCLYVTLLVSPHRSAVLHDSTLWNIYYHSVRTRKSTLLFCVTLAVQSDRFSPRVKGII